MRAVCGRDTGLFYAFKSSSRASVTSDLGQQSPFRLFWLEACEGVSPSDCSPLSSPCSKPTAPGKGSWDSSKGHEVEDARRRCLHS